MQLLDKKITSVYRLCKFISETQQVEKKSLERLIALDELTDSFWNVSYQIYLAILFQYSNIYHNLCL